MTAVRLRGQDAINRALEARQLHLDDGMTVEEIAHHYDATPFSVYRWLTLAKRHSLPELDDQLGWLDRLVAELGGRLEDAKDQDAVRITDSLSKLLGIGSAEVLKQQAVQIEGAKIALIAQAFDRALGDAPDRAERRVVFAEVLNELGVAV